MIAVSIFSDPAIVSDHMETRLNGASHTVIFNYLLTESETCLYAKYQFEALLYWRSDSVVSASRVEFEIAVRTELSRF